MGWTATRKTNEGKAAYPDAVEALLAAKAQAYQEQKDQAQARGSGSGSVGDMHRSLEDQKAKGKERVRLVGKGGGWAGIGEFGLWGVGQSGTGGGRPRRPSMYSTHLSAHTHTAAGAAVLEGARPPDLPRHPS